MAQQLCFAGLNVAVEIHHEHALAGGIVRLAVFYPFFIGFFFFFFFFLTVFIELLQFGFAVQGNFQILFEVFQLVVDLFYHHFSFFSFYLYSFVRYLSGFYSSASLYRAISRSCLKSSSSSLIFLPTSSPSLRRLWRLPSDTSAPAITIMATTMVTVFSKNEP